MKDWLSTSPSSDVIVVVKFSDVEFGLTNKLLNVAVETYPLVDEFPSAGLVAKILTPPPIVFVTANVPSTFPKESTDSI